MLHRSPFAYIRRSHLSIGSFASSSAVSSLSSSSAFRSGTLMSHPGPLKENPSQYFSPSFMKMNNSKTAITAGNVSALRDNNNNNNEEGDDENDKNFDDFGTNATINNTNNNNNTNSLTMTVNPSEMFAGDIWENSPSSTIGASWTKLHHHLTGREQSTHASSTMTDLLLQNDLRALSTVTSRAEIAHLLREVMPSSLTDRIISHPDFNADTLEEIFLHLGMDVELRSSSRQIYKVAPATSEEIAVMSKRIGGFGDDGRACVNNTLHRVSCWMSRSGHIVGLTIRIGRFVPFAASAFLKAATKGSLLLLSPPSCGKTTCLRDLATQIARLPENYRVVVIDTSNEIGGDSEVPLPYLHRVRRLQVPKRSLQLNYMIQAVQNHAPDFVIIDEIASKEEAECAVSMSQRGIRLIATAHASTLHSLLQNSELNALVGGVAHAFLSNEERRMRKKIKKTILERVSSSPFRTVVELQGRNQARIIRHVNDCVDLVLDTGSLDNADKVVIQAQLDRQRESDAAFIDDQGHLHHNRQQHQRNNFNSPRNAANEARNSGGSKSTKFAVPWVSDNVILNDPSHVLTQQAIDERRDVEQEVIATSEISTPSTNFGGSNSSSSSSPQRSASAVGSSDFYANSNNNNNNQHYQTSSSSIITCFRCGAKGHKANDCPAYKKLMNQNNNNNQQQQQQKPQQQQHSSKNTSKNQPMGGLPLELDDEDDEDDDDDGNSTNRKKSNMERAICEVDSILSPSAKAKETKKAIKVGDAASGQSWEQLDDEREESDSSRSLKENSNKTAPSSSSVNDNEIKKLIMKEEIMNKNKRESSQQHHQIDDLSTESDQQWWEKLDSENESQKKSETSREKLNIKTDGNGYFSFMK